MPWSSSTLVSEKMFRTSSSTTSTCLLGEHGVGVVQPLEHAALLLRQACLDAVQEQGRLVQQSLGRLHVLHDDRLGELLQTRLLLRGSAPSRCR